MIMIAAICATLAIANPLPQTEPNSPVEQVVPPNIILLMADDLGYGDTGFTGNGTVLTPHLDRLSERGVRLDRFYSAAPVCTPTRASCLTGRHPFRMNMPWAFQGVLPREEITIGEALQARGYATGHFGKWHVGQLTKTIKQTYASVEQSALQHAPPWEHGFDECFSCVNTEPTFNPYYLTCGEFGTDGYRMVMDRPVARGQRDGGFVWRDRFWTGPGQCHDEWLEGPLPEILVDRAVDFMHRARSDGKPFLTLLWFSTPHTPVVAGPEHRALYPDLPIEEQHWFGAISAMDEQVGRLMDELDVLGIADSTIVMFCSDNGPTWVHDHGQTGGLRGRKGSLHEGGIRVPAFVHWPDGLGGARTVSTPLSTSDLLPTMLAAAGAALPDRPIDGRDVLAILRGEATTLDRGIGFQSPKLNSTSQDTKSWADIGGLQLAWIEDRYKLVSMDGGSVWELYDLREDRAEAHDVAGEHPRRVESMRAALMDWRESCARSAAGEDYPR